MFIDPKVNALLNDQIMMELAAHIQYLAIAHYFERSSLDKLAGFFYAQAEEEKVHALKIVHFLGDSDGDVKFAALSEPKQDFASPEECAELFVQQEQAVTESFYRMQAAALEANDYISRNFMEWFINEQLEEMATATKLFDLIKMSQGNILMVELLIDNLSAAQSASAADAGAAT